MARCAPDGRVGDANGAGSLRVTAPRSASRRRRGQCRDRRCGVEQASVVGADRVDEPKVVAGKFVVKRRCRAGCESDHQRPANSLWAKGERRGIAELVSWSVRRWFVEDRSNLHAAGNSRRSMITARNGKSIVPVLDGSDGNHRARPPAQPACQRKPVPDSVCVIAFYRPRALASPSASDLRQPGEGPLDRAASHLGDGIQ